MPTKIRQNVFETNSSSTHSLSIMGSDNPTDYPAGYVHESEEPLTIDLGEYEFGWEIERYHGFKDKLAYVLIDCRNLPEREQIIKMVSEHIGVDVIVDDSIDERYCSENYTCYKGSIDHQSYGTSHFMVKDCAPDFDLLKRFLFNWSSALHTGNDNC